MFICSSEDIASVEIDKYLSNDFKGDKNKNKTNKHYQRFEVERDETNVF